MTNIMDCNFRLILSTDYLKKGKFVNSLSIKNSTSPYELNFLLFLEEWLKI